MVKSGFVSCLSAASILLAAGVLSGSAGAANRLCALRDGPRGPCTCKSETDGAGQFTVVPKSHCRAAAPAAKQDAGSEAEAPAKASPGAAPAATTADVSPSDASPAGSAPSLLRP